MELRRFRPVVLVALLSLCAIVVTGAAVRLTGSGLGCSDWPGCEDERLVPALELHPWIEFGNRLVTGVVSLAVVAAVLSSRRLRPRRPDLEAWSWALVGGVVAQVGVGALAVIWHLPPGIVAVHFLLSMVLVWCATELWVRSRPEDHPVGDAAAPVAVRRTVAAMTWWTPVLLVAGTVVTAAGPHRGDEDVEPLDVSVAGAARAHGMTAIVMVGLAVLAAGLALRTGADERVRRAVETILAVLFVQGGIGYLQYFTDVPVGLVALHVVGATGFVVALVLLRHEVADVDTADPAADRRADGVTLP